MCVWKGESTRVVWHLFEWKQVSLNLIAVESSIRHPAQRLLRHTFNCWADYRPKTNNSNMSRVTFNQETVKFALNMNVIGSNGHIFTHNTWGQKLWEDCERETKPNIREEPFDSHLFWAGVTALFEGSLKTRGGRMRRKR
ncbi:hypothetical protein DPX16_5981 [Anabarilius grahami]|uniref:Uncharacterized protein n=1 Tax=Anabarilius grahami TaxID=495550 RepID=A0A3N0Z1U6_ANAGA|nr:hypothetical protein DPX16_5981 [Anabarilius grahami]